jgi:hypothetical protein
MEWHTDLYPVPRVVLPLILAGAAVFAEIRPATPGFQSCEPSVQLTTRACNAANDPPREHVHPEAYLEPPPQSPGFTQGTGGPAYLRLSPVHGTSSASLRFA